jgi:hypothetical protein
MPRWKHYWERKTGLNETRLCEFMIKEHDCIVLTQDLPAEGLLAGDIGTVVHLHQGGAGYEVEFMTLAGKTLAVTTLLPGQVRSIAGRDVAHVRELAVTGEL